MNIRQRQQSQEQGNHIAPERASTAELDRNSARLGRQSQKLPQFWQLSNIPVELRAGLWMTMTVGEVLPSALSNASSMTSSTINSCIRSAIRRNLGSAAECLSPEINALGMPLMLCTPRRSMRSGGQPITKAETTVCAGGASCSFRRPAQTAKPLPNCDPLPVARRMAASRRISAVEIGFAAS